MDCGDYIQLRLETQVLSVAMIAPLPHKGLAIAEKIEGRLDSEYLIDLLLSRHRIDRDTLKAHSRSFVRAITRKSVQSDLLTALMNGTDPSGIQQALWMATQTIMRSANIPDTVDVFSSAVKSTTENTELIDRLTQIEHVERLLVLVNNLFHYCRRKDGEPFGQILKVLEGRYDYDYLPTTPALDGVPRGINLERIRSALKHDEIEQALKLMLELHEVVMAQRGGAPWVEVGPDDILRVRMKQEKAELKDQKDLEKQLGL